jgi:hypothetical protein
MASVTTIPRAKPDEGLPAPEAAERALDAARQLLEDWLRLARLEATSAGRRLAAAGALLLTGGALLLLAWVALATGAALALARVLPLDASVGCVALAHALLGAAFLVLGRRRLSGGPGAGA